MAASEQIPGFGAVVEDGDQAAASGVVRDPSVRRGRCPYAHNRITVGSGAQPDRYGVPLPKIDYQIGENERKMTQHMADTVEEIVKAAGGELVNYTPRASSTRWDRRSTSTAPAAWAPTRSARRSNRFNQMHEVKNVFVVDGSSFPNAIGEEPDADDPRALVARDRLSRGRDQARQSLRSSNR